MSRSQEERPNEFGPLNDAPSPISSPPSHIRAEDLPSRSYYSSHIGQDPNIGAQYSASSESIRAQSLRLGGLYMKDDITDSTKRHIDREEAPYIHPQKSSPKAKAVSPSSNLSLLLQRKNDVSTQPENARANEAQPLLGSHLEVTRTTSTQYHSIANSISPLDSPAPRRQSEQLETFSSTSAERYAKDASPWTHAAGRVRSSVSALSTISRQPTALVKRTLTRMMSSIPAVILGVLLNLLDAISYGMITFPLNNPIFASFGPDGISMFYVSCVVAQLVYSCGGSAFAGVNGSMMIEVVPFLHIMAEKIVDAVGNENQAKIAASTVVAFALSSILTGIAFFLLGALNLGALMGFFPRHILVGTIGGVGWFLIATGIEVSGRLEENLAYTLPMLKKLFLDTHTFALWSSALGAALLLRLIQYRYTSALIVPSFFMLLPCAFYLVVVVFGLDINEVRDSGWIFPLVDSDLPFWHFYTYYDFTLVDRRAVAQTIPAMLALTFFGVLHVPINVPALGVSTNNDNIDTNRELIAHGISNAVSGLLGSVQNYLVYTNSLLFIRSGGDSRLAGVMLACATAALWMVGPWIVGYIPVIVVGSLIFHLGLDLLKEALIDTWRSVNRLEYITICVIIACMSALGFVEGILVGIIMACVFFVVQNARNNDTIRSTHTGSELRSTVRRVFQQQKFLKQVGRQIQVIRLQGYLFFGTVNQVERAIRDMLDERAWDLSPIRFLILDMQLVQGLDFSAAEAFVRIRRLLNMREVYMIICNVAQKSDVVNALVKAGVWNIESEWHEYSDLKCFEFLNDALEWCENRLLQSYFDRIARRHTSTTGPIKLDQDADSSTHIHIDMISKASPRHEMLVKAAQQTVPFAERRDSISHKNFPQPTQLLMQAFGDLSDEEIPVEFYHKLGSYLESKPYARGEVVWREGDPCDGLVVLEQGTLRSLVSGIKEEDVVVETILPGTVVGELGLFIGSRHRARSLVAEQDSVLWILTRSSFEKMKRESPAVANQFILLSLHFSSERLDIMTRYAFQLH